MEDNDRYGIDWYAGLIILTIIISILICGWLCSCTPTQRFDKGQNINTDVVLREIADLGNCFALVWESKDGREITETVFDTTGCNYIKNVTRTKRLMPR